jgi:hypothetical protein
MGENIRIMAREKNGERERKKNKQNAQLTTVRILKESEKQEKLVLPAQDHCGDRHMRVSLTPADPGTGV